MSRLTENRVQQLLPTQRGTFRPAWESRHTLPAVLPPILDAQSSPSRTAAISLDRALAAIRPASALGRQREYKAAP
jgi:hypothetical protein